MYQGESLTATGTITASQMAATISAVPSSIVRELASGSVTSS